MKFATGSNAERTQKYARVKVQNDIRTDKQTSPIFKLCYPCKCLARYARSPINVLVETELRKQCSIFSAR